jgi:CRP/FNR family transcriptional regulator
MSQLLAILAQIPYLAVLPEDVRQQISQKVLRFEYPQGGILFFEGEVSKGLWIVEEGTVKISKLNAEGAEYILHLVSGGGSFNDIAALDGSSYPATAAALSSVKCWVIPHRTIQNILQQHPLAAQAAIRMLTARVRSLVEELESLALYSVTARLARYLLKQAENPIPEVGITRAAIAAHLATTPESISRSLRSLEQAGAICFNRHQIEITRPDILRALAFL